MRFILCSLILVVSASFVGAQSPTDVLATASGRSFTVQDLSPNLAKAWIQKPQTLANARKALLDRQVEAVLLETEASERKMSVKKLLDAEVTKKVPNPPDSRIKAIYDANRQEIGDMPYAEAKRRIVDYLRQGPEKKAYAELIGSLRTKHKITEVKDVRGNDLEANDILVTVGERPIRQSEFTKKNGLILYEYEANLFDQVSAALKQAVDAALYSSEAQGYGITTSEYVAREITNKMNTYSEAEQARVQLELRKKLYAKYRVRFFLREPKPFVQKISTDDDPSQGDPKAPVTVVMFTDLQCPACASVYPILKEVLAEYGKSVYFVVRDFPLMSLHENAFDAAVAANAARAQNKYFEYKEILYKNQNSLERASLMKFAGELKLNQKRFAADLNSKKFRDEVRKDMLDGESYGVNSTPTIFVNGIKVRILSAEAFRKAIDRFVQ